MSIKIYLAVIIQIFCSHVMLFLLLLSLKTQKPQEDNTPECSGCDVWDGLLTMKYLGHLELDSSLLF